MPYNSSTSEYERRSTTVIDATPDGDTVAVAIDTKLDLAADDAVVDLNHHMTNGRHYPATSSADNSRFLKQSPAGVVSWANGIPFEDGVAETELAASTGSAMVGFVQSGSGATNRTVQDKLRDVVSIYDFGAKGDGATDDTAAFTAAAASGKTIYLPKPSVRYTLSTPVALTSAIIDPTAKWADLTDSGKVTWTKSFRTASGGNIHRLADRVFIGEAADKFAGDLFSDDGGTSWFDHVDYPGYLGINAHLLVIPQEADINSGGVAICAAVRSSKVINPAIGLGIAAVNDETADPQEVWATIFEMQHEAGALRTTGIEFAAKNKGDNQITTPNTIGGGAGVNAMRLVAHDGVDEFGGLATNPCNCGVSFLSSGNTWNHGIVFAKNAMSGTECIAMSSQGDHGPHGINWYNAAGNVVFTVSANASSDTSRWTLNRENNGLYVSAGSTRVWDISGTSTQTNWVRMRAANSGSPAEIQAQSFVDTNIDLMLTPKGTGVLRFGAWTSNADAAVNGYVTIRDAAGTIRKLATIA